MRDLVPRVLIAPGVRMGLSSVEIGRFVVGVMRSTTESEIGDTSRCQIGTRE